MKELVKNVPWIINRKVCVCVCVRSCRTCPDDTGTGAREKSERDVAAPMPHMSRRRSKRGKKKDLERLPSGAEHISAQTANTCLFSDAPLVFSSRPFAL